jgi:hypothetical protein
MVSGSSHRAPGFIYILVGPEIESSTARDDEKLESEPHPELLGVVQHLELATRDQISFRQELWTRLINFEAYEWWEKVIVIDATLPQKASIYKRLTGYYPN